MKLKDIGLIVTGNTPNKKNKEYYESKDILFVKPSDIKENYITLIKKTEEYISEKARKKVRILPEGTVLVTCIGTIGKVGILKQEATCNQQINAIVPNDKVISKYLAYLIKSKQKLLQLKANAPVVPIINKKNFSEIEINICNLNKQEIIVKKLDLLKKIIDKRKLQIEGLQNIIKSQFVEMFGNPIYNKGNWNKMKLQDLVTNDCKISYGIVQTGEDVENGIPVFRPIDIVNSKPQLSKLKRTTKIISDKYKKTILKGDELLITVRANIGDTFIVNKKFEGCNVGRGITPLRFNSNNINTIFIKYQLDNEEMKNEIKKKAKGITLLQLNMEDLRKFELIVPPIELQNKFADFVKLIDKQKFEIEKSLKEAENLYNSLMSEYFG